MSSNKKVLSEILRDLTRLSEQLITLRDNVSKILADEERGEQSSGGGKMLEKPTSWGCSSNFCDEKAVHYVRELKMRDGFEIVEGRNACRKHL